MGVAQAGNDHPAFVSDLDGSGAAQGSGVPHRGHPPCVDEQCVAEDAPRGAHAIGDDERGRHLRTLSGRVVGSAQRRGASER